MPKKKKAKLTPKQLLFVKYYVVSKNATDAARRAGYSKKTAHSCGPRLLENAGVAKAIKSILDAQIKKVEDDFAANSITKERWMKELAVIGFADMKDYVKYEDGKFRVVATEDLKSDRSRAIRKVKSTDTQHGGSIEVELHPKLQALETLGKSLGWVKDAMELSGPNGAPIPYSNLTEEDLDKRLKEVSTVVNVINETKKPDADEQ